MKPEVKVGGELALHSLEDGVLGCGLSTSSQRLGGGATERRRHDTGDVVLDAHAERADQLRDEVESVRRHRSLGDVGAVLEGDRSTLDQRLAQLTQHLLVPVLTKPHHLNRHPDENAINTS